MAGGRCVAYRMKDKGSWGNWFLVGAGYSPSLSLGEGVAGSF